MTSPEPRHRSGSLPVSLLLGAAGAVVLFLIAASLLTVPLFALARVTEPAQGTGREWFWSGLRWAVVGGALIGVAGGGGVAWWLRRGGKLPEPFRPTNERRTTEA